MAFKNFLIRLLIALSGMKRKEKNPPACPRRFLVVSTTAVGDTLWATPSLRALRQAHPDAYIGILTSKAGREILEKNPHIDEIFSLNAPTLLSLLLLFFPLKKRKIDTALILHTSQRPVLPFCVFIGASEIIGTKKINKGLDSLLTKSFDKRPIHEIARRLEIVAATGASSSHSELELYPSEEERERVSQFLKKHAISSHIPLVGLHPGAKDAFKQWDPDCFIELGNRLKDHLGCQIIVTGGQAEKSLIQKISSQIQGALFLAEQLSLLTLAALIERMSLFISNDTGPMHIALAMRTPTVALFSPTNPLFCGPYLAPSAIAIAKPPTCTPCLRKQCRQPFCLLQISPSEVYAAALKLFHHRPSMPTPCL